MRSSMQVASTSSGSSSSSLSSSVLKVPIFNFHDRFNLVAIVQPFTNYLILYSIHKKPVNAFILTVAGQVFCFDIQINVVPDHLITRWFSLAV